MHGGARGELRRGGGETTEGTRARSAHRPGPLRRRSAAERVEYRKSVHEWFVLTVGSSGKLESGVCGRCLQLRSVRFLAFYISNKFWTVRIRVCGDWCLRSGAFYCNATSPAYIFKKYLKNSWNS